MNETVTFRIQVDVFQDQSVSEPYREVRYSQGCRASLPYCHSHLISVWKTISK